MKKTTLSVQGMSCAACVSHVEKALLSVEGVTEVSVSLLEHRAVISHDETVSMEQFVEAVKKVGYRVDTEQTDRAAHKKKVEKEVSDLQKRLIFSLLFFVPLFYISMGHMVGLPIPSFLYGLWMAVTQLVLVIPILWLNRAYFIKGFTALWHLSPNMDSLIAIGAGAAVIYSLYISVLLLFAKDPTQIHDLTMQLYYESAGTVITLITVGKYLETRSKGKTSRAVEALLDLAPKTVTRKKGDTFEEIAAEDAQIDDILLIRPGETIPVDGIIIEGQSSLVVSALTGESLPIHCGVGDSVSAAAINQNGTLLLRATHVGNDTTLAKIIALVREASSSKVPLARLADKISGVFVPIVIGIAGVTLAAWLLADASFSFALERCISVLVVSCPCSLGLATPVAIMVGTGKAASSGMLFHSASALQTLSKVKTVVFDKTGTLTKGQPEVQDVIVQNGTSKEEFIALAAGIEMGSNHPLATAVTDYAKKQGISPTPVSDIQNVAGKGLYGTLQGKKVIAGNAAFLEENHIQVSADVASFAKKGKTMLLFATDDKMTGFITVVDPIKDTTAFGVSLLKKMGIKTVLLSGDQKYSASAVGEVLSIDEVISEVLPADKAAHITGLQQRDGVVAMVGDGINDAPALAKADVGIAVGAGADIAIESADIVLMQNDVTDVANAILLSRKVTRNILQNLFWAFFYNSICIPIATGLFIPLIGLSFDPMFAAAAMSLSSVFVVTNALRLQGFKKVKEEKKVMKKTIGIDGMMCMHCAARVEETLKNLGGQDIQILLEEKKAIAFFPETVSDAVIKEAITAAGYTVTNI